MSNDRVYVYLVQHCSCLVVLLDGCEGFADLIHALSLLKNLERPSFNSAFSKDSHRHGKDKQLQGDTGAWGVYWCQRHTILIWFSQVRCVRASQGGAGNRILRA